MGEPVSVRRPSAHGSEQHRAERHRPDLRRAVAAAVLAVVTSVAGATAAQADPPADEVAVKTNEQRGANGRAPLARDASLDAAAYEWALRMGSQGNQIEHASNDFRRQYARPGWQACCGENIAAGYGSASAVMTGWMESPGHRANILNGGYTHIGVGHTYVPGSHYGHYWVQVFATYPVDIAGQTAFVKALYRDFLGREAGPPEVNHWLNEMARGWTRKDVAMATARSDEWITHVITRFYQDTLNRAPDASGRAGWVRAAQSGMPMAQIASAFYASPEYFGTVGKNDNATWLRDLYQKLLNRGADAGGLQHWLGKLRAGTSRADVAMSFYQSTETARVRVDTLYRDLLDRPADSSGLGTWPPIVIREGDLALAAWLASSAEYYARAKR